MTKKKTKEQLIYSYTGLADEALLSFMISKIESTHEIPKALKRKLSICTLELINNIIEHHYKEPFCKLSIKMNANELKLMCESKAGAEDIRFIREKLKVIRSYGHEDEFYLSHLRNTNPSRTSRLGLTRIYRNAGGNMRFSASPSQHLIRFTLKFNLS